jgi:LuxR family maltose regulon positive regulatory protein
LAGRIAAAEALLQIAEREERQGDDSRLFWRERHFKGLANSMLAAAKGDCPAALAAADRLIEEGRRDGRKMALIEAYLNRARILLPAGATRAEGLVPLALALELACDLGACGCLYEWRDLIEDHALALQPTLQPRTRGMLVRLRVEWRGTLHPGLSSKEINVLRGVATGLTNKQISRELDVSVETVKFHLKQCFRKLTAQTRTDAVQKARNAELI